MHGTTMRDWTLTLLRVVSALLFMQHGAQKLFGVLGGKQVESLASQFGIAGILEVGGGLLILIGLFTRPVAFLLSGEMAFAYWMSHAPRNVFPILNGGDGAILYCFIFLYIAFAGGGAWSLDRLIWKKG